jgi:hypothetical protein
MDTSSSVSLIVSVVSAGVGFCIKYFVDKYSEKQKTITDNLLESINFKLKDFYFPIYYNILRENIIWNKLIKLKNQEEIIVELDVEILKTHLEVQKIIQTNIILVNPKKELLDNLMLYDEHVTIFSALRSIGKKEYPVLYDSPYPKGLFKLISEELNLLKKKQHELLNPNDPLLCSTCCIGDDDSVECQCKSCWSTQV